MILKVSQAAAINPLRFALAGFLILKADIWISMVVGRKVL
jgi:hypothetical protein